MVVDSEKYGNFIVAPTMVRAGSEREKLKEGIMSTYRNRWSKQDLEKYTEAWNPEYPSLTFSSDDAFDDPLTLRTPRSKKTAIRIRVNHSRVEPHFGKVLQV